MKMDLAAQWRQGWLSGMIVVEFSEQQNGIARRGKMVLHSGGILEIEGSQSPVMIQTLMLLHGLKEVQWNDKILTLNLKNRKPDIRRSNIEDDVNRATRWTAPARPVPYKELHVIMGRQNLTDYSWYTIDEYGALRIRDDGGNKNLRVSEIMGPTLLCSSHLPCPLDVVIAYLMAVNGKVILSIDGRSALLPGRSRDVLRKNNGRGQEQVKQKVEVVEFLYAGRGY